MDLRSLISKIDNIEKSVIMERIRNADVMATASIADEAQRLAALGKLATDNGYPGMFDPQNGKYVKADGTYSFTGPSEAEVKQLELHGLLPKNADTSSWLGMRGRSQQTAQAGSQSVVDRDTQVDRATALITKALATTASTPAPTANTPVAQSGNPVKENRSNLASLLIESFGYDASYLAESITKEEHEELNKIMASLDAVKNDEEVAVLKEKYKTFIEKRNALLARINELIATITKSKAPTTPAPQPTKESRIYLNEKGMLVEGWRDEFQKADDFVRSVANSATFGYADNLASKANAWLKSANYADELKSELEKTAAAEKRNPGLSTAGDIAGSLALPGGILAQLGYIPAKMASTHFVRDPHNLDTLQAREEEKVKQAEQLPATAPTDITQQLQAKLKATGVDIGKFGVDGKFGPDTVTAIQTYKQKNKLPSDADAIAQLLGQPLAEAGEGVAGKVFGKLAGELGGKEAGAVLGDMVRVGGKTFEKYPAVPGKYIDKSTGKLVNAEEVAALKGTTTGVAKPAVDAAASTAVKPAADAVEKGFVEKFGFKAGQAYTKTKAVGGKALSILKNNKLLAFVAALAAFGYMFDKFGNIVTDSGEAVKANQGSQDDVSPEETELCKLLQQLIDGWPADQETQDAINATAAAGAKCQAGGGAQPDNRTPLEKYYDEIGTRK